MLPSIVKGSSGSGRVLDGERAGRQAFDLVA